MSPDISSFKPEELEYLERNFGLEFIAVFHTIAINTLIQDYLNRLGSTAPGMAKSIFATWRQNILAGCNERLQRAQADHQSNPQAPDPAHLKQVMTTALGRAQADVLNVLMLTITHPTPGTSPEATS